jgi:hypothetical protein
VPHITLQIRTPSWTCSLPSVVPQCPMHLRKPFTMLFRFKACGQSTRGLAFKSGPYSNILTAVRILLAHYLLLQTLHDAHLIWSFWSKHTNISLQIRALIPTSSLWQRPLGCPRIPANASRPKPNLKPAVMNAPYYASNQAHDCNIVTTVRAPSALYALRQTNHRFKLIHNVPPTTLLEQDRLKARGHAVV